MELDSLSITLALITSIFAFLIYTLALKKNELEQATKYLQPVTNEIKKVLMQNFLATNHIPSKSELISVISAVANKYQVHLLSHQPIHQIIDALIYEVASNELLEHTRKESLISQLIELKSKPMNSEDYIYMIAEIDKTDNFKSRYVYNNHMKALICASALIIGLSITFIQFKDYWADETIYMGTMALIITIGFSAAIAISAIYAICSNLLHNNRNTPEQRRAMLALNKQFSLKTNSLSAKKLHELQNNKVEAINNGQESEETDNNHEQQNENHHEQHQ